MAFRRKMEVIRAAAILATLGFGLVLESGCIYVAQNPQGYSNNPPAPQPVYQPPTDTSYAPPPSDAGDQGEYQPPPADVVTVYDNDLGSYGTWVNVEGYGRCWSPNGRPGNWQPYTIGHWEYCDYGWTWVSEDDEAQWGAITYHYGRWYQSSQGWVWIPGVTWAPAWVAWREGGGYCGWAPLPPQAGFGPQVNVAVIDQYVPPQRYVYCNEQYVSNNRVDQHIVQNNVTIINQTTNITNITVVNNRVVNQGISVNNVQRATGRPVEKVVLTQATTSEQAHSLAQAGKPVIYSPPAVEKAGQQRMANARTSPRNPKPPAPVNAPIVNSQEPQPTNPPPPLKSENYVPPKVNNPPENGDKTETDKTDKSHTDQDQAAALKLKQQQEAAAQARAKAEAEAKAKADAAAKLQQEQASEKNKSNKPASRPSGK